ncbi:Uncharacterised protein r2_g3874 [Pycnogonum litorale]
MESTNVCSSVVCSTSIIALLQGAGSGIIFAIEALLINLSSYERTLINFFRSVCQLIVLSLWILIRGRSIFDNITIKDVGFVVLQGFMQVLLCIFFLEAFKYMPFADVNSIIFSSPALIAVLDRLIFGVPLGLLEMSVAFMSTTGLVLTLQPEFIFGEYSDVQNPNRTLGSIYALLCLLLLTAYYLNSKVILHINFAVVLFSNSVIASIAFFLIVLFFGSFHLPSTQTENLYFLGILVFCILGRCLFNKSLTYGKPFSTKIGRMLEIPTSYFLQCTIQEKYPSLPSVFGAMLIVLSSVIFSSRDFICQRRERTSYRKLESGSCDDDGKSSSKIVE